MSLLKPTTEIDLHTSRRDPVRPGEPGRTQITLQQNHLHASAHGGVSLFCQFGHEVEKRGRLTVEKPH
jgi:hypothetical protein